MDANLQNFLFFFFPPTQKFINTHTPCPTVLPRRSLSTRSGPPNNPAYHSARKHRAGSARAGSACNTKFALILIFALIIAVSIASYAYTNFSGHGNMFLNSDCDRLNDEKTGAIDTSADSLDLWFISNLKDAPLKLNATTHMLIFPQHVTRVWVDVGVHLRSV